MFSSWRRLLARRTDGLPEARHEAALALLRAGAAVTSAVAIALNTNGLDDPLLAGAVNLAIGLASAVLAVLLARQPTAERARSWGRWSTVADVALFATYAAAFGYRPGASGLYGAFVLVVGPVRYGWRGLLATTLPVALVAVLWPQADAAGTTVPASQIVLLCVLLSLPAVVGRAVATRGSARLHQAEQQFATAFEHASIGMALADRELRVVQANRSLGVLLGRSPQELLGSRLDAVVERLDRPRLQSAFRGLTTEAPSTRLEVRLQRPDGGQRWGHVSASLLAGAPGVAPRIVVQIENITERKRSEAMLSHAASHDALTDLPNRSTLLTRLDSALHRGEQVGVLLLDLDRFKVVNDTLGHAAGDLVLVQVALRLREVMRPDDVVARLGGDEFAVLCRNADGGIAGAVATRVLEILSQPIPTAVGGELLVGGSIGIALGGPGDTADLVLRDSDTAMHAAKAAGRGKVQVFHPELRAAVVRTHELEVDLRAAVRAGELSLAYQPVIHLTQGWILGCEALARWNHKRRGAISPTEFIAVAEQSDLILELGDWALRRALEDVRSWPNVVGAPVPTIAVNVSLRQLTSPGFPDRVAELLDQAGVEPSRLCLEVTETALTGEVEPVVEVLEALRAVGVRLSIDDFGTGHASLTYLARFPVDQVKVDQTFVAGLGIDAGSAAIVGGVIAMAHTFDLRVVAEGVETEEQLTALRDLGCDAIQGYLLGAPMKQDELSIYMYRRHAATGAVPLPRGSVQVDAHPDPRVPDPSYNELRLFRLLVEGAKDVTGRLDLETVLEHAFLVLNTSVAFTGGSIMLIENEQVRIAAGMPAPTAEALAARIPLGQGVSGTIAVTGEPRYLPDITIASTVTAKRRSKSSSSGVRSWFGVPLIAEGNPIGVLQIDSTEVDAFDESDRLAVLSFAPVVALAVVCARHNADQLRAMQQGLRPD